MEIIQFALVLIALSIGLVAIGFWIWMLVDCIRHEPREGNDRVVWVLVIVFTKLLGAAIYYFVRRPERMRMSAIET